MRVTTTSQPLEKIEADALVIPWFENEGFSDEIIELSKKTSGSIVAVVEIGEFKGKLYETTPIFTHGKILATRVLLVGLGKKADLDSRLLRNVAGAAARRLVKMGAKKIAFNATLYNRPSLIVEGIGLGEYDGGIYKTGKDKPTKIEDLVIVGKLSETENKRSQLVVETVNEVRNLINEPANQLTPKHLVAEAKKIAFKYHLGIEILDEKEAAKRGMGAFVGISKGSAESSYILALKYTANKKASTLGVVGKGITFDSGGLSIKPSEKMHEMKMDMAGAATAIGFMKLVGELKPKINVVAVTPITENLPGGRALKPGDVVTSLAGKTIEVINTDAEGRVVLADGLTWAQKLGANKIVDLATLTGAVIVALGGEATAILGNKQGFVDIVKKAGEDAGERMWQLPIYPEHKEMLRSEIADIANIPPSRGAGVIAGAVFLEEFIDPANSWVHLDIAGTAWMDGEKPYMAKGPTGVGIRTLLNVLEVIE